MAKIHSVYQTLYQVQMLKSANMQRLINTHVVFINMNHWVSEAKNELNKFKGHLYVEFINATILPSLLVKFLIINSKDINGHVFKDD